MVRLRSRDQQSLDVMLYKRQLRPLPHRSDDKNINRNTNKVSIRKVKEFLTKCDDNITNDNSNDSNHLLDKTIRL